MNFVIDENLGRQLANGFRAFGENVDHVLDTFAPGTPDTQWLAHVGRLGTIVITRDERIRRRTAEKSTLIHYGLGVFFLGGQLGR